VWNILKQDTYDFTQGGQRIKKTYFCGQQPEIFISLNFANLKQFFFLNIFMLFDSYFIILYKMGVYYGGIIWQYTTSSPTCVSTNSIQFKATLSVLLELTKIRCMTVNFANEFVLHMCVYSCMYITYMVYCMMFYVLVLFCNYTVLFWLLPLPAC
jgi:hypothetical protein